ncbi:MAG: hypothetical protein ACOC34_04615 [Thermotogota bacterium]
MNKPDENKRTDWPVFDNEDQEVEYFDNLDVSEYDYEPLPENMKIKRQHYRPTPTIQETFIRTVENLSYLQGALREKKDFTYRLLKIMREVEAIEKEVNNINMGG